MARQKNLTLEPTRVTEEVVRLEPKPEFTKTWHPFSHGEILDATSQAIDNLGWKVGEKEYSIRPGANMIAVWDLTNGEITKSPECQNRLLIRNSIKKKWSVAYGVVEQILICSNLSFSAKESWVTFRRHTGHLTLDEIVFYAEESLRMIAPKFEQFQEWLDSLKEIELSYRQASALSVFAMNRGYLPHAKFPEFWENYDGAGSKYKDYQGTMYAFYNAQTELMRGNSLITQGKKQEKLNYFMRHEAPALLNAENIEPKKIIDLSFEEYKTEREEIRAVRSDESRARRKTWKKMKKAKASPKKETTLKIDLDKSSKGSKKTIKEVLKEGGELKTDCGLKIKAETPTKTLISKSEPTKPQKIRKCSCCGFMVEFKKVKEGNECPHCGEVS